MSCFTESRIEYDYLLIFAILIGKMILFLLFNLNFIFQMQFLLNTYILY